MGQYESYLTRVLKEHDKALFAKRNAQGVMCVYRKSKRFVGPMDVGVDLYCLIDSPQYVFSLTDNWTSSGEPIPWGSEVVIARIKEIDLWNHEKYLDEVDEQNDRVDRGKRKDMSNHIEAFAHDFRRQFARATNDINTSTLDKSEKKRRKRDGNRERNERCK